MTGKAQEKKEYKRKIHDKLAVLWFGLHEADKEAMFMALGIRLCEHLTLDELRTLYTALCIKMG